MSYEERRARGGRERNVASVVLEMGKETDEGKKKRVVRCERK